MARIRYRWTMTTILVLFLGASVLNIFLYSARVPQEVHRFVPRPSAARSVRSTLRRAATLPRHLPPPPLPHNVSSVAVPGCRDTAKSCETYKRQEGCLQNPAFMLAQCKAACGLCRRRFLASVPSEVMLMEECEVRIAGNVSMPLVGYGTAGLGMSTQQAVQWALQAGYRLLDSAQAREWYWEPGVGAGLRESGIDRRKVFLTSKLHPRHHGFASATRQLEQSLKDLGTDYLDMLLLHYPVCWEGLCGNARPEGTWKDSWRALESAVRQGKLRAVGVSNFDIVELAELLKFAEIKPAVVQRNSDPFSQDVEMLAYCRISGIQYQAYSSLGTQWLMRGHKQNPVLSSPVVKQVAAELGRSSPAQVVLKWALQSGMAVIPQSGNKAHIASNLDLGGFALTSDMLLRIDSLDGTLT